jgi:hypothetical protein
VFAFKLIFSTAFMSMMVGKRMGEGKVDGVIVCGMMRYVCNLVVYTCEYVLFLASSRFYYKH